MTDEPKIDVFRVFAERLALETEIMNFEQRKKYIYDETKEFFRTMEAKAIQLRFIDSDLPLRRMDAHNEPTQGEIRGNSDRRRDFETTKPFEAEEKIADS